MRRTTTVGLVLGLMMMAGLTTGLEAQSAEDQALKVVEDLFVHMKAGDADAMASLMHPDVRLISTGVREGVPVSRVIGIDGWLESVRNSESVLDEQIYDSNVQVAQGLAAVWTSYDLFVDGAHSHCGVDLFELVRGEDGWKIIGIADTRATEGCRG